MEIRWKAVCVSRERKTRAWPVSEIHVCREGIEGDIHFGLHGKHPVSLLPWECVSGYLADTEEPDPFGRFGENLLLEGADPSLLQPGTLLHGSEVTLVIARVGAGSPASDRFTGFKVCSPMEPYFVFCEVVNEGTIRPGEIVRLSRADEAGQQHDREEIV